MNISLRDIYDKLHIYPSDLICYTRFPFSRVWEERNLLIYRRLDLSLQLAVSRVAILPLSVSLCSGLKPM